MPDWTVVKQASLVGLLIVAGWQDVSFRLISNRLVVMGAVIGLVLSALPGGQGMGSAMGASLVMFLSFFVLYLAGWLGAGDVKLAGATGVYFRAQESLELSLVILIAGGVVCFIWSLWNTSNTGLWGNVINLKSSSDVGKGIPYALSICFGVFYYLWIKN